MKSITREGAIERLAALLDSPGRFILGVIGKPGVGKSTFTQYLGEQVASELVAILPMDGFHMSNQKLIEMGRRDRKGAPDTFDVDDFAKCLADVRDGHGSDIRFPIFEREIEASIPDAGLIPAQAKLVVVEGNYLLHDDFGWEKIGNYLDESWYLDVDDELRMQRLIARHIQFGKTPEAADEWSRGTDEVNARLIEQSRSRASFTVTLD
jgi:pantothenate kinase